MATLTGPMTLVQRTGEPLRSLLFMLPVYQAGRSTATEADRIAACIGWTYAPLSLVASLATIAVTLLVLNWSGAERKIEHPLPRLYETDDAEFRRSLSTLLGPALVEGNQVRELVNGDAIFSEMLAAIRSAQRTITFETYFYWSGKIGREFVDALSERARNGVNVHVLLDWVGSIKMENALLEELRAAGIEVERFHKPHGRTGAR